MTFKNIMIADDHHLILDGFESILKEYFPDAAIHKATSKIQLFKKLNDNDIDVLFQDIKLSSEDARDFTEDIRAHFPTLKIIIISTLNDEFSIQNLFKKGIDGYISKADDSSTVIAALRSLSSGRKYVSPDIRKSMEMQRIPSRSSSLTPREKEVLSLIVNGYTTKQIAQKIFLSEKTIEIYRSGLFLKFDVKNVAALVKKALYEGF